MPFKITVDTKPMLDMMEQEYSDMVDSGRLTESVAETETAYFTKQFDDLSEKVFSWMLEIVQGIPSWSGSDIIIKSRPVYAFGKTYFVSEDGDISTALEVTVQKPGARKTYPPSFTTSFDSERWVDDVLDAGDPDFFDDPGEQADYFSLVYEIRHPGSSEAQGNKALSLYTARPSADRSLYENADRIPTNVFLTNDVDEAYGYALDLRGSHDVWMIRIRRKHLVETLSAGRKRNYQAFSGGPTVPVESTQLVASDVRV